jgi:hypothetical protein
MIYLAVPIKGLMRMMADRRHSLIYLLNWGSGGCGVIHKTLAVIEVRVSKSVS